MPRASSFPGSRRRSLLAVLCLTSTPACQYVFGDFDEEPVVEVAVGGASGASGGSGTGGGAGSSVCAEGTAKCDGRVLLGCSEGSWIYEDDCASAVRCDDSGAGRCLACLGDEFECIDDENSRRCEDGEWVDLPPCEAGLRCDPEIEQCARCREGDGVCVAGVLCLCHENQTEWEAFDCPLGCAEFGFRDRCADDLAVSGGPVEVCTGIEP